MGVVTSLCCAMRLLGDPIFSQRNSKVYLPHVHVVLYVTNIKVDFVLQLAYRRRLKENKARDKLKRQRMVSVFLLS